LDGCPACGGGLEGHRCQPRAGLSQELLEEAMDTPNGALVRRCFRILNAEEHRADESRWPTLQEEEFRVLELIEAERHEQTKSA